MTFLKQRQICLLDYSELSDELKAVAESVASWGEKLYEEEVLPLEDYRELLEITLGYLGAPQFIHFLFESQVRRIFYS